MASAKGDLLAIVEAAYLVDAPDDEWLKGLAESARPLLDDGFGLAAFEFYRPNGGLPEIVQRYRLGIPPKLAEVYPLVFQAMDPEIRQRPFDLGPCVSGSQLMGMREEFRNDPLMRRYAQTFGMFDSVWITAAEPSGYGFGFHSGRRGIAWPSPSEVRRWGRIAAHLSAAVRLRRRLRAVASNQTGREPEAVLDPDGNMHDASGPASQGTARNLLQRAVVMLEKARGRMRVDDPDQSLGRWKGLVAGRWSLVDQIEHDGRRYIVARQNEPAAPGPESLTAREKQVIAYAKLGHHNKLIAYELGVADSTVRVLLARAASKLGVHSRAELLSAVG